MDFFLGGVLGGGLKCRKLLASYKEARREHGDPPGNKDSSSNECPLCPPLLPHVFPPSPTPNPQCPLLSFFLLIAFLLSCSSFSSHFTDDENRNIFLNCSRLFLGVFIKNS